MFARTTAALIAVLLLAAPVTSGAADEPITIRVAATANDTYAEAYYAQERGEFQKAGLNVQLTTFTNGASVAQAVVGGSVDIGISNVVQIGTAVEKGIPLRYFAGGGLYASDEPTSALCVAQNAAIKTAKDFEGQTIGVSTLKDTSAIATEAWLVDHGADLSKIKFVELPFAAMGPSLARGTIAGAVISEPSLSAARTGGARIFAKSYDGIASRFLISGWFTTLDYQKQNPLAVKRFAQVIYATAHWANSHRADSAKILVKYAQLDPIVVRDMARCQYAENLDLKMLQPALDAAAKYGALDRPIAAADIINPI
ncbi:MAG TPA: ABC transporter substrate-binding protein [Candidatus Lustribacter sp.]|jgi:NitT/TauT family transport system substrate-binding protein|nr:ABC transporter substrate-binding protein [Candidatus Lustribacter sp.]